MASLRFTLGQVGSTNNLNQTNPNEVNVDILKTFADVSVNGGVNFIEATVDDSELVVNDAGPDNNLDGLPAGTDTTQNTGETNFLGKDQFDGNTTFTSFQVVMNDGTVYELGGGSAVDFREQDPVNPPGNFTSEHGDTFVESNGSIQLVDANTGIQAPTGPGAFGDLSGENLVFSSTAEWNQGTQTRLIDSSGNTSDTAGDGLFTVDNQLVPDNIVDGAETSESMTVGYTDAQGDQITIGDDVIEANGGDDVVFGGAGNDTVSGGLGDDAVVAGGDGDDSVSGGAGADNVFGGDGNDTASGGAGDDTINGNAGADVLTGGDGADTVKGGVGNDTVGGNAGDDFVVGNAGADVLTGGGGADTLNGGLGDDTMTGGAGDDDLTVASGDDASGGGGDDAFILDPTNTDGPNTISIDGGADGTPTSGDPAGPENGDAGDSLDFTGLTNVQVISGPFDDGTGSFSGGVSYENDDGEKIVVEYSEIENLSGVPCFTRGTLIKTDRGEVPVEDLAPGDRVMTIDHGLQPIRWIGSRKVAASGSMAPVRIAAGALGNIRDLLVSPQHRMLLSGWRAELNFGEAEVLAASAMLVNDTTIRRVEGGEVEYFHMLFDTHEIVWSEGAPSESFHPGEQGWNALERAARDEILAIFPELDADFKSYGPAARMSLKAHEAAVISPGAVRQ